MNIYRDESTENSMKETLSSTMGSVKSNKGSRISQDMVGIVYLVIYYL